MNKINVAVIEDTEDIRINLVEYMQSAERLHCVACYDSIESFLDGDDYEIPDIILSDIGLPGRSGIHGIPLIKEKFPESDIVMFTVYNESDQVFNALCAGAVGYILKGTPLDEIEGAIITISNGGSYMSAPIARKVVSYFSPKKTPQHEKLNERETEITKALAEGLSYKLIADKLYLSLDTVRYHIKSIYRKLQVNSKAEVIRKVLNREI